MTVRFDSIYNGDPVVLKYTKDSDRKQIELAYENADGFFLRRWSMAVTESQL